MGRSTTVHSTPALQGAAVVRTTTCAGNECPTKGGTRPIGMPGAASTRGSDTAMFSEDVERVSA